MEAESAATAAIRATEQDIKKMRAEIKSMRHSMRNIQRFVQHDRLFHRHIALASGNRVFVWFIDLLQKVLAEGQLSHARSERLGSVITEHHRIVAAIEAHESDVARAEMLAHLTLSRAYSDQHTGLELRVLPEEYAIPGSKVHVRCISAGSLTRNDSMSEEGAGTAIAKCDPLRRFTTHIESSGKAG